MDLCYGSNSYDRQSLFNQLAAQSTMELLLFDETTL